MKIKFKDQEIEIPEGVTFKVVGGDLVISPAKDEFKNGDILHVNKDDMDYYCIYKDHKDSENINYYAFYNKTENIVVYNDYCMVEGSKRATSEECNLFLDAIEKDGKHWNNSKHKFEDILKVGDICIFWDDDKTLAVIGRLSYMNNSDDPYGSNYGYFYKTAIKCISLEQYQNFISEV
jgi:hypothetical protein